MPSSAGGAPRPDSHADFDDTDTNPTPVVAGAADFIDLGASPPPASSEEIPLPVFDPPAAPAEEFVEGDDEPTLMRPIPAPVQPDVEPAQPQFAPAQSEIAPAQPQFAPAPPEIAPAPPQFASDRAATDDAFADDDDLDATRVRPFAPPVPLPPLPSQSPAGASFSPLADRVSASTPYVDPTPSSPHADPASASSPYAPPHHPLVPPSSLQPAPDPLPPLSGDSAPLFDDDPDDAPIRPFDRHQRFFSSASSASAAPTGSAGSPLAQSPDAPAAPGRPGSAGSADTTGGTSATGIAGTAGAAGTSGAAGGATWPAPLAPSLPPGVDATSKSRRRFPLIPAIAFGCALMLLVGIGSGILALNLRNGQRQEAAPPASTAAVDPTVWRPLASGESPEGTAEDLLAVLSTNPVAKSTLPVPVGCELPQAEGLVPPDQLSPFLTAGGDCLASMWKPALKAQGIDFEAPRIVVYEAPSAPADSACAADSFSHEAPRACLADSTLYWPAAWDPGFSNTTGDETAQLYMWHLSYSYAVFALAAADLDTYVGAAQEAVADEPERADQVDRRYALQLSCLGAASAFQLPAGPRPGERVEEFVTSVDAQADPVDASDPSAQSRAAWVEKGRSAHGTLAACDAWSAPAADVG